MRRSAGLYRLDKDYWKIARVILQRESEAVQSRNYTEFNLWNAEVNRAGEVEQKRAKKDDKKANEAAAQNTRNNAR